MFEVVRNLYFLNGIIGSVADAREIAKQFLSVAPLPPDNTRENVRISITHHPKRSLRRISLSSGARREIGEREKFGYSPHKA